LTWQAIINAYNDHSYTNIVKNTKAIIFLGTPHRGADLANLLNNVLTISFSKKIFVDQLRTNSEIIQEINDTFRDRSESLELISYYESEGIHAAGVSSDKIFTF
jgi:triacylglycerol esterase/lipase EstA (alpha/beta hydrolase family)